MMQFRKCAFVAVILQVLLGFVTAQQCDKPNVAVIVVVSVFATLAVVFIVLGIIFFLLWKRRQDIQRPAGTPLNNKSKKESTPTADGGYTNPSFNGDGDISYVEEGIGGYVKCHEHSSPEKSKISKTSIAKDPTKKTWTSLPISDLPPGPLHNGSAGSLDDHYLSADPDVSSVWLQSQDFIGLGFNIVGSMRDGIYVSQVHNRGPAMESGKFKVGDRILTVTISFENMVYEDALTILSYASPYPVKVTLQKERHIQKERKNSGNSFPIQHPLYRSQSADTLLKAAVEPAYHPSRNVEKISQSNNFFPEKKKSPSNKGKQENDHSWSVMSERVEPKPNVQSVTMVTEIQTKADIEKPVNVEENVSPLDYHIKNETAGDDVFTSVNVDPVQTHISTAQITFSDSNASGSFSDEPPPEPSYPPPPLDFEDYTDSGKEIPISTNSMELSSVFDTLNEQDRLDMLRLSYEDPDTSLSDSLVVAPTPQFESSVNEANESLPSNDATLVEMEPKSPIPVKPERRKKKSSSSSVCDSPTSPRMPPPDDVIEVMTVQPTNLATQCFSENECLGSSSEINEDVIVPQKKDRVINISSEKIEFSELDQSVEIPLVPEDSPRDVSKTLVDYSLSDMESTLRPQTPENNPIEEDMITPVQAKKDQSSLSSNFFDSTLTPNINQSKSDNSQEQLQHSNANSSFSSSEEGKNESKVDNTTITSVDFNLNMNEDLFSTPYPSRKTKETSSGITYDISVMELNDIESQMKKNTKTGPKGGIAFEVREDVVSGSTVLTSVPQGTDSDLHISRAISYQGDISTHDKSKLPRPASFKEDNKNYSKNESENPLEWSGKRLVRSGSFSDIPQDGSASDWMDHKELKDENGNKEGDVAQEKEVSDINSSEESLRQTEKTGLSKMIMFRARENLANLSSENSDSHGSLSESSSRSSTPPPPYTANGEQNNEISPDTSPVKTPVNIADLDTPNSGLTINTDFDNNDVIPTVTNKHEGNNSFSVTVNTELEDEADC